MPTLQVLSPFNNFAVDTLRDWEVASATSSQVVFRSGVGQLTLQGSFTIDARGAVTGSSSH